ncbi:HAD-IIB family hydrolase [Paraferrimonas haliotis]|uniref:Mannosyl-3-phosphoglycerate phosphatase n=1 Tax=Paraferrimonas haliotis TaxID=2013866 RepID=A0AA37TR11_9GAMM|nr:HAD-IIB family hydrolase [Paraferrimonas haliotis]GLS83086.1 mannosyl-3-phosphoglycerate phosphatase [Paraferrimonas haliotis]
MNRYCADHTMIATDLDGTLLDHYSYSYVPAQPALSFCQHHTIPIIVNTSKTRLESMVIRKSLGLSDPFIVENGSAVCIPKPWMARLHCESEQLLQTSDHWVLPLGTSRHRILAKLEKLRALGFRFQGFSEMPLSHLMEATGLSATDAELANQREYSEPIIWQDSDAELERFKECLKQEQLTLLKGGRFYHVLGATSKGRALRWLKQAYQQKNRALTTVVGLGDSANDIEMLNEADIAIWVRSPIHGVPSIPNHPMSFATQAKGPAGWNEAIASLFGIETRS